MEELQLKVQKLQELANAFTEELEVQHAKYKSYEFNNEIHQGLSSFSISSYSQNFNLTFYGNLSWMMICSILVLFMTLPGLVLFFCGMIREKNVLSVCMQVFSIACMISIIWVFLGYSIAYGPAVSNSDDNSKSIFGDLSRCFLNGITSSSRHELAPEIPEISFVFFELGFAVISPALIVGSFADRMKFSSTLLFLSLWHLLVYCPICHIVWHQNGFLYGMVEDFAGGLVVHVSSGISGLVSCLVIGPRKGFKEGENFENTSILYTFLGTAFLWFGWFGFNGGSAFEANYIAAHSLVNTQVCCCVAAISWLTTENFFRKKPSVLGMVNGAVSGLVVSAPLAGIVDLVGAFTGGIFAGSLCFACAQIKFYLGFDDALDTFAIHYIGGSIGVIIVSFFAVEKYSEIGNGIFYSNDRSGGIFLGNQLLGLVFVTFWSAIFTYIILKVVDYLIGLRVSADVEDKGLDIAIHNETLFPKNKTDTFERYKHVYKIDEEKKSDSGAPQTKYEKYQSFVGKYLS